MNLLQILSELKKNANTKNIEQMAKFGISPKKTFGVKIPILRQLGKKIGKNHQLAQKLWQKGFRETQILASIIDEPDQVSLQQIENWIADFHYWEICDQCVANLFEKKPFCWKKCIDFANDERKFFPLIKKYATDERNMVKKAVNWALRQIGKRNLFLHKKALKIAKEILEIDNKAAKWIAGDAIREFENEKIIGRIKK